MNPAEETAREVAVALGVGVFPIHWIKKDGTCSCGKKDCKDPGKHPLTAHGLSDASTNLAQIDWWAAKWPKANWAMVPGDKYVVLDRDIYKEAGAASSAALEKQFPGLFDNTVAATTPRGGCHDWFELPPGEIVSSKNNALGDGLDGKSRGGYVLLPGSRTDAGIYAWKDGRSWKDRPPPLVPPELLALLPRPARKEGKPKHRPFAVPILKYIACDALAAFHKTLGEEEFMKRGVEYYGHCPVHADKKPSLRIDPEKQSWFCDPCGAGGGIAELYAVVHGLDVAGDFDRIEREVAALFGVTLDEESGSKKKSKSKTMLELVKNYVVFHDSNDESYITLASGDHDETYRILDPAFARRCAGDFFEATGETISMQIIQEPLAVLDAIAQRGPVCEISMRYARAGGYLYVDLGRKDWKILRLCSAGYNLIDYRDCPERFIRPRGMGELPLPAPANGLTLRELHKTPFFSNLEWGDFLLVIGFYFAAAIKAREYPLLMLPGGAGLGKTTLLHFLKLLIDPGSPEMRNQPRDVRAMAAAIRNTHLVGWDNVTRFNGEMAAVLSSLLTGGSISDRKLYENYGEASFPAARPVVITSIADIARPADLVDRIIAPSLRPFTDAGGTVKRRSRAALYEEFDRELPRIFGFLCDAMCGGLGKLGTVKLPETTRMMDVTTWMLACLVELGSGADFMEAYMDNRANADARLLDESPLFTPILSMAATCKEIDAKGQPVKSEYHTWSGTHRALLDQLNEEAAPHTIRNPNWPRSAWHLSRALTLLQKAFRSAGVIIDKGQRDTKGKNRDRLIHIHHADDPKFKNKEPDEDVPEHPRDFMEAM